MSRRDQRRRSYVVNKSLQYRFLALIIIYSLVIVLFLAAFLFIPHIIRMQDESLSFHARAAAAEKILTLHVSVWPVLLFIICLVALHSFRSFHRLIGPLVRFRSVFGQVGNGDLSLKMKIREKDYLHQEEEALNNMIGMLSEKMKNIQQASADAMRSLNELEHRGSNLENSEETHKEMLRVHRQHLETLTDAAGYFKVKREEQEDREEPSDD